MDVTNKGGHYAYSHKDNLLALGYINPNDGLVTRSVRESKDAENKKFARSWSMRTTTPTYFYSCQVH